MTGASSRWTCDKCNAVVAMTHKGHHRKFKCPEQGLLRKALEKQAREVAAEADRQRAIAEAPPPPPKFFQYLTCVCGCGDPIGQVRGQRKRQFVDASHYEKWRRETLRAAAGDSLAVEELKRAEEVAAVAAKDDAIRLDAEAVRLLSPEASFALWMRWLDKTSDTTQAEA